MDFEVIVVGAGIGGLVTAALLSARGVNVGLFERQPQVGGCLAEVEHQGFRFEPTYGLYGGWEAGGIFDRIFSELPIDAPGVTRCSPSYVVRLPDGTDISVSDDPGEFDQELRRAFPECAGGAVEFYESLAHADANEPLAGSLQRCSQRFRRFLDIQLQTFAQCPSDRCSSATAAAVLCRRSRWTISEGAQSLAEVFAKSFENTGGRLRLNAPVLRLAYASDGTPAGVDLLTGERINGRTIISNLTIWDTYGKLIGLSRTPREVSSQLKTLRGWGAYLLFATLNQSAAGRLPANHLLALTDWQDKKPYDPVAAQLAFAITSSPNDRKPDRKLAATASTFTNAEDWFSFHESHEEIESMDQSTLAALWRRLHQSFPELGDGIEAIQTATPQTFYENTRRRFGMMGMAPAPESRAASSAISPFRNLHIVSDTVAGSGVDSVARCAYNVANQLTARR